MIGYHFTRPMLFDGRPIPPVGEWLEHVGFIEPCASGLHASEHPFDALLYAPGALLHRVELVGDLQSNGEPIDKYVGRRRRIIASIDARELLREFARWCALQVIDLWDAPDVVRKYLSTGDESIRVASSSWAARASSWATWAARASSWASLAATEAVAVDKVCAAARATEAWAAAKNAVDAAHRKRFREMVESAFAAKGNGEA